MSKPFFLTTFPSFGTFYGHENRNIIHSFKVAKPWRSNYMLHRNEIPKCGHRLSFFISYSSVESLGSHDFPTFEQKGSKVKVTVPSTYKSIEVKVSSASKSIEPARIYFLQLSANSGGVQVEDGQKVKIQYELYDYCTGEVRYETYLKKGPEIIGPGKNDICEGLYEGIVGMRVGETRRIVLPPSSDLTGGHRKSFWNDLQKIMRRKPSSYSEEHRIYDVKLVKIIG